MTFISTCTIIHVHFIDSAPVWKETNIWQIIKGDIHLSLEKRIFETGRQNIYVDPLSVISLWETKILKVNK